MKQGSGVRGIRSMQRAIFVMCIFAMQSMHSFICEVYSIKKSNPATTGPTWVIGLGDLHDKRHPTTQAQKDEIMRFLSLLPADQVTVLTEDLSSPGSFGRRERGNFWINSRGGVLGGITQDCQVRGLDAQNHEFRYCRVSSLGPVINGVQSDLESLGSTGSIKMADLHKEIRQEIDLIRTFNDGLSLKKAYGENIAGTEKLIDKLKVQSEQGLTVAQYLKKAVPVDKRPAFVRLLLTFDSELLDCKFLHAIKAAKNKKYVILIAGGAHVKRVCDLLLQDGYHKHCAFTLQDERVFDKKRCNGRTIENDQYCIMPRAIDLSCLPGSCDLKK